ncbi:hypothetical protein ACFUAG_08775 [Streptomyces sp. NPDC057193]|uniref:hypothetical protein n=1 Tax=unclassified Streptomyces TaxID=2593676 RepID=UPI00093C86CC|nr:hypothetical protein [Streptomyces sp. CB02261]OKJ69915.1 hypothetical protein AMK29_05045 [Streptomyces sp. CB02261]
MPVIRRWAGRSAVALAVALSATACGGGGGDAPEPKGTDAVSAAALKTCQELFGENAVAAVKADLGGEFRAFGLALPDMKSRMLAEAQAWTAAKDDLRRVTYRPCELEGKADGSARRVSAAVSWSMYDIAYVSAGQGRLRWRTVADGVYVASRPDIVGTPLVMPCTVAGTAAGQGEELPLQVSVLDKDRGGDRAVSTEQLLKSLAESTRELLGCEEKTAVPDDLLQ